MSKPDFKKSRQKSPEAWGTVAHTPGAAPKGGKLKAKNLKANLFEPRSQAQIDAKRTLEENDMIFIVGPAGTAKSFMAAAQAVDDLRSGRAEIIVLSRAAVEAGDSLGFLPGDADAKMRLYCQPMLDALGLFLTPSVVETLLAQKTIQMIPTTYLRGKSIPDAVIIIDEFQNSTPAQGKLVLTRAGENTRTILTCDPDQIDLADHIPSAVEDLELFENIPGIAIIDFTAEHVTRSAICKKVLEAYAKKPTRKAA